jgi:hypothetical protein
VADKLIQMYNGKHNEDYYTKAFKKLFAESNNFARKMSNPLSAKGDEKLNGFFNKLQQSFIDPSRIAREKYKDELKVLDEKVASTQMMLSAAEQQELKVSKGIQNLLRQYSNDPKTSKYIVDMIIAGTNIFFPTAGGGKAKRRRRMMGGNLNNSIVGYFENNVFFEITDKHIIPVRAGLYNVEITEFKNNSTEWLPKDVLPEVKALIVKYNRDISNLDKIIYAGKLMDAFKLATNGIDLTVKELQTSTDDVKEAVSYANKAINTLDQTHTFNHTDNKIGFKKKIALAVDFIGNKINYNSTDTKERLATTKLDSVKTAMDTFIKEFEKIKTDAAYKSLAFAIIKAKYKKHPMIAIDNKLAALV